MIVRLVELQKNHNVLLCHDGGIREADKTVLHSVLLGFKTSDKITSDKNSNYRNWSEEYPEMSSYPGKTIAYVTDNYQLVIDDITPFHILFDTPDLSLKNLVNVKQFAEIHGRSSERIKVLCRQGRIRGAQKVGRDWLIPADSQFPADERVKTRRYM